MSNIDLSFLIPFLIIRTTICESGGKGQAAGEAGTVWMPRHRDADPEARVLPNLVDTEQSAHP